MADKLKVMISSTALDLPEHRKQAMEACLRQGMFPIMMEYLPASDSDAISESLVMVDAADIYLGIFGHRYGYVPADYTISITEMEINRAAERGIPRLVFIMHDDHPVRAADVETGEGAVKLKALKQRLTTERIVNVFESPADLRAKVIDSLSRYHERSLTEFHHISDIPQPPAPYIAHPYTLLQTSGLIGRQAELNVLTDWVAKPDSDVYKARILNVVAVGGMGKSALTWKWFNDIAPLELQPLAGRMWWSFYESDASFENFVTRALAYVSHQSREEVQQIPIAEREALLLHHLDREPFLIVLDGLERMLIAYARMDAARLADDDLDERTANVVAGALGLPASAAQSYTGQFRLRRTIDLRAGSFLRRLARVSRTRILVSTRLFPADLQTVTGAPFPGSFAYFLGGLSDDDALALWRALGVTGTRDELLKLFNSFENYPLLIRALAGEVANYRRMPGNFESWRQGNPNFNSFNLPLVQAKTHVLAFALRGLSDTQYKVLSTIAAFRSPATYDTLAALFVGEDKIFAYERELDTVLAELEDRGLIGWDKFANRYDLHPIVRGVVWNRLDEGERQELYESLYTHFEAVPKTAEKDVTSVDELTVVIELYNSLIELGRYDDAFLIIGDWIFTPALVLGAYRLLMSLAEMLFVDVADSSPRVINETNQKDAIFFLAICYNLTGLPGKAIPLYERSFDMMSEDVHKDKATLLIYLSQASCSCGHLVNAEAAARKATLLIPHQANRDEIRVPFTFLGAVMGARGAVNEARTLLEKAIRLYAPDLFYYSHIFLAKLAVWIGDVATAKRLTNVALHSISRKDTNIDQRAFVYTSHQAGELALIVGDLKAADDYLHTGLLKARTINFVEEELGILIALAELRRREGRPQAALEYLDDVWEGVERGPYPLLHADALNVLAQIERDAHNNASAVEAATRAYKLAWCDGPPYAYHWGLEKAKAHLHALGVPEPGMPPFDPTKHEPMPDINIDMLDQLDMHEDETS